MAEEKELIRFLRKSELFHNLSEEELQLLLPLIRVDTFENGTFILKEGERGDDLYLIEKGSVEILKEDKEHGAHYRVALIHPDEWFGEMAILGSKVRITSVKALEKTETIILHLKDLEALAGKHEAFAKIAMNLVKKAAERLETANELTVKFSKEELRLTKTHDQMGRFVVHLFILLTFFVYALKFLEQYGSYTPLSQIVVSLFIISFGVSGVLLIKNSGYPLQFYGLTMKSWQKNAIDAALFTIPVLIIMVVVKWVLIETVPSFNKLSVFEFANRSHSFFEKAFGHLFGKPEKEVHLHILLFFYIALVPIQEFIARGCLQSSLRNFFISPNRVFLAILTSNLLFGLFHGLKSFTFALCAFLLGIFWGWIYERQKTIVGPCVSHILVGIWAFGVLNYQSILIY
jgi:CRP-like cAMP-binding protein